MYLLTNPKSLMKFTFLELIVMLISLIKVAISFIWSGYNYSVNNPSNKLSIVWQFIDLSFSIVMFGAKLMTCFFLYSKNAFILYQLHYLIDNGYRFMLKFTSLIR